MQPIYFVPTTVYHTHKFLEENIGSSIDISTLQTIAQTQTGKANWTFKTLTSPSKSLAGYLSRFVIFPFIGNQNPDSREVKKKFSELIEYLREMSKESTDNDMVGFESEIKGFVQAGFPNVVLEEEEKKKKKGPSVKPVSTQPKPQTGPGPASPTTLPQTLKPASPKKQPPVLFDFKFPVPEKITLELIYPDDQTKESDIKIIQRDIMAIRLALKKVEIFLLEQKVHKDFDLSELEIPDTKVGELFPRQYSNWLGNQVGEPNSYIMPKQIPEEHHEYANERFKKDSKNQSLRAIVYILFQATKEDKKNSKSKKHILGQQAFDWLSKNGWAEGIRSLARSSEDVK